MASGLLPEGGSDEELRIIELTDTSFIYEDIEQREGGPEVTVYTLEPAILNINASIPTALTNERSKLWRFESVIVLGEPSPIAECQQDELVLYNRDGTGAFIFGETDCDPNETVESDFFRFTVSEDGSMLVGEELNSPDGSREELTVLELTDSVFRYISMETLADGTEAEFEITLVPALQ